MSNFLVEDLWVNGRTPERLLRRSFKRPRDVVVELELDAVDSGEAGTCWEDSPMKPCDATQYRAIAARLDFLSIDRPDIQCSCKEATRRMATPINSDWSLLKRIGRYLLGTPRVVHCYEWQAWPGGVTIFVDSNWAGCVRTRKSTTGVCVMHGKHLLRSFSKTQANIALSSAEAELYAMVLAASEGLGAKAMCLDYGCSAGVVLNVDASAAIGVAQRKGLGKLRHLNTQALWIQDAVRERRIELKKVSGTENPADLVTKHLDKRTMEKMIGKMGFATLEGRSSLAPTLTHNARGSLDCDHSINSVDVSCDVFVDCIDVIDRDSLCLTRTIDRSCRSIPCECRFPPSGVCLHDVHGSSSIQGMIDERYWSHDCCVDSIKVCLNYGYDFLRCSGVPSPEGDCTAVFLPQGVVQHDGRAAKGTGTVDGARATEIERDFEDFLSWYGSGGENDLELAETIARAKLELVSANVRGETCGGAESCKGGGQEHTSFSGFSGVGRRFIVEPQQSPRFKRVPTLFHGPHQFAPFCFLLCTFS